MRSGSEVYLQETVLRLVLDTKSELKSAEGSAAAAVLGELLRGSRSAGQVSEGRNLGTAAAAAAAAVAGLLALLRAKDVDCMVMCGHRDG